MNMEQKPLCTSSLLAIERARLLGLLDALCGYLNSPGDWGYKTQLGEFTVAALNLHESVRNYECKE